jgi:16S rRNA (guanine527-N7)-methyltransferase
MSVSALLAERTAALGFDLSPEAGSRLLEHLAMVQKWNRVHNLTAIRDPEMMLVAHVLDSLAVIPYIAGPRITDIGSGAGFPGIPLALARPDWHITLIESNHKKAAFLQQIRIDLQLKNVRVVNRRAEEFQVPEGFDTVISRAFASLADFARLAGHLCLRHESRLAAMKGVYPHEELLQLPTRFAIEKVLPITVPGLEAKRHLVIIKASGPDQDRCFKQE